MQPFDLKTFHAATREAKKIAVVDMGFLGDTLHLVPALWEIRRHYPGAEVHVLTSPSGADILRLAPGTADRTWIVRWHSSHRNSLLEQCRLSLALRRERFDAAINFSGADRTLFFTAFTGAPWRVAYPGGRTHFWNRWLVPLWTPRQKADVPVYEQKRQVLAACGMALEQPRWDLRVTDDAASRAAALVPGNALHFSINASAPVKEWPLERWVELTKRLLDRDGELRIIATGSDIPHEREQLKALGKGVENERLVLPPVGLPVADLAALLQRCRLHAGSDSGVLHLAVALGIPTVSLFRESSGAAAWMPRGPSHRVVCVPCDCMRGKNQPCAAAHQAKCLAEITAAQIEALVRELWS